MATVLDTAAMHNVKSPAFLNNLFRPPSFVSTDIVLQFQLKL